MPTESVVSAIRSSVLDRWNAGRHDHGLLLEAMQEFGDGAANDLPSVAEALQRFTWQSRDAGIANALGIQFGLIYPLLRQIGAESARTHWAKGITSRRLLGAFAVTERATGSQIRDFRTSLTEAESSYVLNGEKWLISLAPVADVCIVACRTGDDFAVVLVDMKANGVTVDEQRVEVIRTCPVGAIRFENVNVRQSEVLATGARAKELLRRLVDIDRAIVWRFRVGRLQSVLELAVAFGMRRTQSGRPLTDFQTFAFRIGEIRAGLVTCETLMRAAAEAVAESTPDASLLSAIGRLQLGRETIRASSAMLHMLGGNGLADGSLAWMYFADSRLDCIGGGADEVVQGQIARQTLREFGTTLTERELLSA